MADKGKHDVQMMDQEPLNEDGLYVSGIDAPGASSTRRGCFFWGCLSLALIGVLLGGCGYMGYRQIASLFEDERVVFEEIPDASARAAGIRKRLLAFKQGLPGERAELVLSAEELNILLLENADPTIAELARFQRMGIADSSLKAEVSFPVDWGIAQIDKEIADRKAKDKDPDGLELVRFLVGNFEGSFLNFSAELGLAVEDERVRARVLGVVVANGAEWGPEDLAKGNGGDIDDVEEKIGRALDDAFFKDAPGRKMVSFRDGKLVLERIP